MLPGDRLSNRYEIARPLGAGGMGQVFLARDVQLERDVAIKILPPDLAADARSRERLRREARATAALDHPFVCKVFDVRESDGQLFIVMELVVGQTLHERLAGGPLPVDDAIVIASEIAEAPKRRFQHAIEQLDGGPVEHRRGQSREWYAEMLLARGRDSDRDRAVLGEARRIYTALEFNGLLRRMREIT